MTVAMLATMVLCFALSVSVAVSIGLSAVLGMQVTHAPMLISVKEMFNSINKFPLAAIPFFILAGNLMETGGISRRLVEFAKSIVGGVQGGLPMTCVLTCMIFAAVSGSSVATTFAIGTILIPALVKHGYPTNYAAALQAFGEPLNTYYSHWTEVGFGLTDWAGRPTAIQILSVAFKGGAEWNAAHWKNDEFDGLLGQIEAEVDQGKRAKLLERAAAIMYDEVPAVIGYFTNNLRPVSKRVAGVPGSISQFLDLTKAHLA